MTLDVRDFQASDHDWARALIGGHQGGDHRAARLGELLDPLELEGIVAELDGRPVALLTVHESDRGLEVVSLHSEAPGAGAGTRLLETALRVAAASGAERLWLVTTNDNLDAIRWYLRRGMTVAVVHADGVTRDRAAIKPHLPMTNPGNGFPIRDYVELELRLADGEALRFRPFPLASDIDRLPPEAAADALQPLFEHAPRFLARLADERPFGDDDALVARAHELARSISEDEQIELLNAHPRIGADPETVSPLSRSEQGYEDAVDGPAEPWIAEELEALNDAYERVFGFRFVIFVAGRPRSAIVPILETSLRDERVSELRRGLDDVVYIAADRLRSLRGDVAAAEALEAV
jgi:2-oxo-4-hydroxy-4-carboxy--5-ureidoimidazoline (OHCU) decarboxylase/GNAT superfamily N-acetyltransferase